MPRQQWPPCVLSGLCGSAVGTRHVCAVLVACLSASALAGAQPSGAGTIRGVIAIDGKVPGNAIVRMGVDPKCALLNAGARVVDEAVVATASGRLANVFVSLKGTFPSTPVPAEPVVIDQRRCVYAPRVLGMRLGQTHQIRNDDVLLHNVQASSVAAGNSFNIAQPIAGLVFSFTPKSAEVMVKLGCDVHRWMTSYVGVLNHPYFAVSRADGTFEIGRVPPGTYTIEAWHERLGVVAKTVTVRLGAVAAVGFSYSAIKP